LTAGGVAPPPLTKRSKLGGNPFRLAAACGSPDESADKNYLAAALEWQILALVVVATTGPLIKDGCSKIAPQNSLSPMNLSSR